MLTQMVVVITLSILFNIPRYLDDHVVKTQDGSIKIERTYLGNNNTFQIVYAGIFYYVVIYFLPVLILSAMTHRHVICHVIFALPHSLLFLISHFFS